VQVVEHLHLQVIIPHGDFTVLRHHKVDPHHVAVNRSHLKAEQRMRKYLLRRMSAQHLVEEVNPHTARRTRYAPSVAVLHRLTRGLGIGEIFLVDRNLTA
jgi:hypothetical protein